jgi:hypothetical protein
MRGTAPYTAGSAIVAVASIPSGREKSWGRKPSKGRLRLRAEPARPPRLALARYFGTCDVPCARPCCSVLASLPWRRRVSGADARPRLSRTGEWGRTVALAEIVVEGWSGGGRRARSLSESALRRDAASLAATAVPAKSAVRHNGDAKRGRSHGPSSARRRSRLLRASSGVRRKRQRRSCPGRRSLRSSPCSQRARSCRPSLLRHRPWSALLAVATAVALEARTK